MALPQLPVSHQDFISYVAKHPGVSVRDLVRPFNEYESNLRELFAQSRDHEATNNPHVNIVPLYSGQESDLQIRARSPDEDHESSKYIMPLKAGTRRLEGSPAMVETYAGFKKNFNLFSESSLTDLNWDNVVVAGSAVVTSLLPVSQENMGSTRALRTYYHDQLAPSSDVDLFLWGLTEKEAIQKIKSIETSVKNSILAETTTIRTKHAITIVSQYPTRHVQIVLRIYKSISEILTGFDVDCSCFAYDGSQVYGTPRGIASFVTQCNVIDLTRRSPSYENRLSKYAARGFEIFCAELDRDRIDPTIYDRAFARVQGLARLLVLERLPKESDRDNYRDRRRRERARPPIQQSWRRNDRKLRNNFKDKDPQDVAEWVMEEQDDVSNYHSFTIPYGPRYNAKKIEKLVYTKDLLLNAEWNDKKGRTVNLHRHPCFVGDAEFIITDCCGTCPEPKTSEEREIAEEESKRFVSHSIEFIKDDPGRQSIGSFFPLTSADWTNQAYLGNMESLCQAIVEGNLDFLQEWCKSFDVKEDHRDHTGRTPLHLACQIGSVAAVKILVDAGARIISRLTDGLTALHIACIRGDSEIINILLEKSEANEELEAEKDALKRKQNQVADKLSTLSQTHEPEDDNAEADAEDDDEELVDLADEQSDTFSMTQGSFVKISSSDEHDEEVAMDKDDQGPDVYDVNILAWDAPVSPLHLAIICGNVEAIRLLVSKFGADVLLPVKGSEDNNSQFPNAILTLVLAARHTKCSMEMTKLLLDLGASPSQSDIAQFSAIHSVALLGNIEAMKVMMEKDMPKAQAAIRHIIYEHHKWRNATMTPLISAIHAKDENLSEEFLKAGAPAYVAYDDWAKVYTATMPNGNRNLLRRETTVSEQFNGVEQPVVLAAENDLPRVVELLLDMGVNIDQLNSDGLKAIDDNGNSHSRNGAKSLLDIIEAAANAALPWSQPTLLLDPPILLSQHQYLHKYDRSSYQYWQIQNQYVLAEELLRYWQSLKDSKDKFNITQTTRGASPDEVAEAQKRRDHFESLRNRLVASGAKTFAQLHPDIAPPRDRPVADSSIDHTTEANTKTISLVIDFEIPSVHDTNKDGYIQLFEAAWRGDKEKIKLLTTKTDEKGNVVRIAVHDNMGITPLHIAIWRGEYDIADLMLEIAHLQHAPRSDNDTSKRRYQIRSTEFADSDTEYNDQDDFFVSSELVNQDSTIEDIANLSTQVGSKSEAVDLLSWRCQFWMFASLPGAHSAGSLRKLSTLHPHSWLERWNNKKTAIAFFQDRFTSRSLQSRVDILDFAIDTGDIDLVWMIIKWHNTYAPFSTKSNYRHTNRQLLNPGDIRYLFRALRLGHFNIASELVTQFGCGMPIQSLMEEAGVQDPSAAKYYQGLLVRGKYKKDWAKEANKTTENSGIDNSLRSSLLLQAISAGDVAVVEWCLSDSPQRLLTQWLSQNKDERIQHFVETNSHLEDVVTEWLSSRQSLAVHMAVLSNRWESELPDEQKEIADVLRYLIRVVPESLETKNISGHTPLALAFCTRRVQAASILIGAGANQTTRNYEGSNIIHLALNRNIHWSEKDASHLAQCLTLVDKSIIASLFVERSSLGSTGMTPLAVWLSTLPQRDSGLKTEETKKAELKILEILLKHMDDEPLRMVDGGGQMPLHSCLMENFVHLLEHLCTKYPELVLLENGMGQTPLELCYSLFVREAVNPLNASPAATYARFYYPPLHTECFRGPLKYNEALEILKKTESVVGAKARALISSLQASEVAKRLAHSATKMRWSSRRYYRHQDREGVKYEDEVEKWLEDKDNVSKGAYFMRAG